MNIIRANDYDDMSKKAAAVLAAQIIMKPASPLAPPRSGPTPTWCPGMRRAVWTFPR